MKNKLQVLLIIIISSLCIQIAYANDQCHSSCGGTTVTTDCIDNGQGLGIGLATECLTCAAATQTLVLSSNSATAGSCVTPQDYASSNPCSSGNYLHQSSSSLTFCTTNAAHCAVCTAVSTSNCATVGYPASTYSYSSEPSDKCETCAYGSVTVTADSLGTCAARTAYTACNAACGGTSVGTDCLSYPVSGGSGSGTGLATECLTCAAATQTLVLSSNTATAGSCVTPQNYASSNPCSSGNYLHQSSSSLTFCTTNAAHCAVCTAVSTSNCATVGYPASVFSYSAEPTDKCATCPAGSVTVVADSLGTCTRTTYTACNSACGGTVVGTDCLQYTVDGGSGSGTGLDSECLTCPLTKTLLLASNTAIAGTCVTPQKYISSNPCSDGQYLKQSTSSLAFCTANSNANVAHCAVCTTTTACATVGYLASVFSYTADPTDKCATCDGTRNLVVASTPLGTCTAKTAYTGCNAACGGTVVGTDCLSYPVSGGSGSGTGLATECKTCAAAKTLVLESDTATAGSCVTPQDYATTAPCATGKYLKQSSSSLAFCSNSNNDHCAVCTSSDSCATVGYLASVYSYTADPSQNCASCTSQQTFAEVSDGLGTCTNNAYTACNSACGGTTVGTDCLSLPISGPSASATGLATECKTCATTKTLVLSSASATAGSCMTPSDYATIAPCPVGKYLKQTSSSLDFCTTNQVNCAVCTATTSCATVGYAASKLSYTQDPTDQCATCTTTQQFNVVTSPLGTCTEQTPYSDCNSACGGYTVGTDCLAVPVSGAPAGTTGLATECLVCSATQTLLLASASSTSGSCVTPSSAACQSSQYLKQTASTANIQYCTSNAAHCAVCTSSTTCKTFTYASATFSFDTTIVCESCNDGYTLSSSSCTQTSDSSIAISMEFSFILLIITLIIMF